MKAKIVTTSWDDGHMLDMKLGELLNRYDLAATFYIAPENREIETDRRLSEEDILKLAQKFEIGAHTMTHPRLSEINDEAARQEINVSKKYLADLTGKEVKSFCYPSGDYKEKHERMVQEAGFSVARTVERFKTEIGQDLFAIPTTVHAYQHWSDVSLIFSDKYRHWDRLAISLFEKVLASGGVFHIWGHSWEIDKNKDWDRLERVFKHIANHSDFQYITNGQLA